MLIDPTFYISMAQDESSYYSGICLLFLAGALLFIVGFLGCFGAYNESQRLLVLVSILWFTILLEMRILCNLWYDYFSFFAVSYSSLWLKFPLVCGLTLIAINWVICWGTRFVIPYNTNMVKQVLNGLMRSILFKAGYVIFKILLHTIVKMGKILDTRDLQDPQNLDVRSFWKG